MTSMIRVMSIHYDRLLILVCKIDETPLWTERAASAKPFPPLKNERLSH
jgi:hypothetical protein